MTQQADAARKAGDLPARLQAVLQVRKFLHDAPDAVAASAGALAEVDRKDDALDALDLLAAMGQSGEGLPPGKVFSGLTDLLRYQEIVRRLAANKTPVSRAMTLFSLTQPDFVAEDIDYNAEDKSFLISGVLAKKIIRVTPEGKSSDFALSPSHWPMLAVEIDPKRKLVWATEVALDGFASVPSADWGRSAVLCFDSATGKLKRRIDGPAHSALGDIALTPAGELIVSDSTGGGVYRVRGNALERIDGGDFISPQTPVPYPDGQHLLIPDYARGLGLLDSATKRVIWLAAKQGLKHALNGIDGLCLYRDSLLATQNGTNPPRVVRFQLGLGRVSIVSEEIIERSTATVCEPTHGVIVGNSFCYIAHAGWSELDEHGVLKPGAHFTPARIMSFPLLDN